MYIATNGQTEVHYENASQLTITTDGRYIIVGLMSVTFNKVTQASPKEVFMPISSTIIMKYE